MISIWIYLSIKHVFIYFNYSLVLSCNTCGGGGQGLVRSVSVLVLLEAIQGEPCNYVIVTIFHMYAMLGYMMHKIVYWLVMYSFGIGRYLY